jgi:hypothetical protein
LPRKKTEIILKPEMRDPARFNKDSRKPTINTPLAQSTLRNPMNMSIASKLSHIPEDAVHLQKKDTLVSN